MPIIYYNGEYERQQDDKPRASRENQRSNLPYVGSPSSAMGSLEERERN